MERLSMVLIPYPHNEQLGKAPFELSDGTVVDPLPRGMSEHFADVHAMLRNLAYDICEVPIISYLVARDTGAPVTALPIFVTRNFDHAKIVINTDRIHDPSDLAGKRVGVRYHAFTDGSWARGILADSFGIDLDAMTWVTAMEEVVEGGQVPANVECHLGASLDQMMLDGDIDAQILTTIEQYRPAANVARLFPDLPAAEREWYERTQVIPLHHVVVARNDVLARHPALVDDLLRAFTVAKEEALAAIEEGWHLDDDQLVKAKRSSFPTVPFARSPRPFLGPDPLPYGIQDNLPSIEALLDLVRRLHTLRHQPTVDEIFAFPSL